MKRIAIHIFPVLVWALVLFHPFSTWAEDLVLTLPKAPETLDPHRSRDPWAGTFIFACYQRLTAYTDRTTKVIPSAALTWRISDDRMGYTFVLKKELTFSDGRPLDAEAVRASFSRAYRLGVNFPIYFPTLKTIEVIGPYTLRFGLARPDPSFLDALASSAGSIVSPAASLHPPDYLDSRTLGSGIFQIEGFTPPGQLTLTARRDLGSKPAMARVQVVFEPDSAKRIELLERGRVHMAADIGRSPGKKDRLVFRSVKGVGVTCLAFNCRRAWTAGIEARRAAAMAIDKEKLIKEIVRPDGRNETGFLPAGMWGYLSEAGSPVFAPRKAAGIVGNIGPPSKPLVLAFPSDGDFQPGPAARYIKNSLAEVGIESVLKPLEPGINGSPPLTDYDLHLGRFRPALPVPEPVLTRLVGMRPNPCQYRNQEVERLLINASSAADSDKRLADIYQIQRVLAQEIPYILLFGRNISYGMDKRIQGFNLHPALPEVIPLTGLRGS